MWFAWQHAHHLSRRVLLVSARRFRKRRAGRRPMAVQTRKPVCDWRDRSVNDGARSRSRCEFLRDDRRSRPVELGDRMDVRLVALRYVHGDDHERGSLPRSANADRYSAAIWARRARRCIRHICAPKRVLRSRANPTRRPSCCGGLGSYAGCQHARAGSLSRTAGTGVVSECPSASGNWSLVRHPSRFRLRNEVHLRCAHVAHVCTSATCGSGAGARSPQRIRRRPDVNRDNRSSVRVAWSCNPSAPPAPGADVDFDADEHRLKRRALYRSGSSTEMTFERSW